MKHTIKLGLLLSILWIALSGHFTPLMLSFAAVSVALVLWLNQRMFAADKQHYFLPLNLGFFRFVGLLMGKIFIANIDVCLRILGFKPIHSQLIRLPNPYQDDVMKVLYANAITLTPGTASVHMENGHLYVHTLSEEGAQSLRDGEMVDIMPRSAKREDES